MDTMTDLKTDTTDKGSDIHTKNEEHLERIVSFDPPLYRQRYCEVAKILEENDVHKAVDFGSAECKAVSVYRTIHPLEELHCVDIDGDLLRSSISNIKPLNLDFVCTTRTVPLTVTLNEGDLSKLDDRFKDMDAVIMVEVVEHLYEDVLLSFPNVIFGAMRPRLVVMTTPNADFNVLFEDFTGFRHPDHKFEWSRDEFQTWCETQAGCYGYRVGYRGVGAPPAGRAEVGYCSQLALFTRDDVTVLEPPSVPVSRYREIHRVVHPAAAPPRPAQRARAELEELLHVCRRREEDSGELVAAARVEAATRSRDVFMTEDYTLHVSIE